MFVVDTGVLVALLDDGEATTEGASERPLILAHVDHYHRIRMAELVEQCADFPLGAVDASVVAVAERLGVSVVATIDHRHFRAVRPRHQEAFTIVP